VLFRSDGRARFKTLFDGWKDLGTTMGRMWGFAIVGVVAFGVIMLPPMLLVSIPELQTVAEGGTPNQNALTIKWLAVSVFASLIFARFPLVLPLIVERGRPILESITESWRRTSGHWPTLIGLVLLLQLLNLPSTVISLGLNQLSDPSMPPEQVLEALPIIMGAYLGTLVLSSFTTIFSMMVFASIFRQLMGPAPHDSPA